MKRCFTLIELLVANKMKRASAIPLAADSSMPLGKTVPGWESCLHEPPEVYAWFDRKTRCTPEKLRKILDPLGVKAVFDNSGIGRK